MAKTRSKKPSAAKSQSQQSQDESTSASKTAQLEPSVDTPPQLFILPHRTSPEARILTLPNPATCHQDGTARFLVCPNRGFFEFTRVSVPKRACRSWLLAPYRRADVVRAADPDGNKKPHPETIEIDNGDNEGYVMQQPDLFVATPIDPLFILMPAFLGSEQYSYDRMPYLSLFDHLEALWTKAPALRQLMRDKDGPFSNLEKKLEKRIAAVSMTLGVGNAEEEVYRLDMSTLLLELVKKAKHMADAGLPKSMEDRFVKQALEKPVLSVKREESGVSLTENEVQEAAASERLQLDEEVDAIEITARDTTAGAESQPGSASTSQGTMSSGGTQTTADTSTSISTAQTSVLANPETETTDIAALLCIRTALHFILASYVPAPLRMHLDRLVEQAEDPARRFKIGVDFKPLTKHLAHLAKLRGEAQALRTLSDNISRKRSAEDDEEAMEKAEAKKRKKEEEEMRKKNTSRGVKQLEKVDRSGMKKLSSFFGKAPAKKVV